MRHPVDVHVGDRVRFRRKLLGFSQTELAEALELSFQQIQKYEKGSNRVSASRLYQAASILDVPISFFFDDMPSGITGPERYLANVPLIDGETTKLIRAYSSVEDDQVRKSIRSLVKGLADGNTVDTKTIPAIAPGTSETVSLFVHFHNAGPVRISAELEPDSLIEDNARRTVAVIRDEVSVLSVEGSSDGGSRSFIVAALRARGGSGGGENFAVQSVPWIELPAQDLATFDVVILQNVPEITPAYILRLADTADRVSVPRGLMTPLLPGFLEDL